MVATPPNRLVPPSTVAAMTSSSSMIPAFGEPFSKAPGEHDAGERAEESDGAVDRELDAANVDAHRPGRLFPAA